MRAYSVFIILMLTGCGVYLNQAGPEVDAYKGPRLSDAEVAIIDHAGGCFQCVKLIRSVDTGDVIYDESDADHEFYLGANKIRLRPGNYFIRIHNRKYKSKPASASGYVDLVAGRTYYVDAETCLGIESFWCAQPNVTHVWMEDAMTGEVVLGVKN